MIASVKELWRKAKLPKDILISNLLIDLISNEEILKSRAHYELIISVINNIIPEADPSKQMPEVLSTKTIESLC